MKRRSKKAKIRRKKKKATLTRRKTRRNITRRKMTRKITPRKKRPKRNRKRRMQTRARPTIMLKMRRRHAKGKRLLATKYLLFTVVYKVCMQQLLVVHTGSIFSGTTISDRMLFFGCFCVMNNTAALYWYNKYLQKPPDCRRSARKVKVGDCKLLALPPHKKFKNGNEVHDDTKYNCWKCQCGDARVRTYCQCTPGQFYCPECYASHRVAEDSHHG